MTDFVLDFSFDLASEYDDMISYVTAGGVRVPIAFSKNCPNGWSTLLVTQRLAFTLARCLALPSNVATKLRGQSFGNISS